MTKVEVWPPWEVTSLRQKLEQLSLLVEVPGNTEPEVLSWMSRMLVVRSSGFVEQTAHEVCRAHVRERSGGPTRSFALSWLEWSRNPSPENLCALVGRFDTTFEDELVELLDQDDQRVRRELALMVDRRNKIAHGLNEGITRDKALALKKVALEVSEWLVLRFNPYAVAP
jgi:hypothetical protein